MFQGAIVTFVGFPMVNGKVIDHVAKDLATMTIAHILNVGETIEINGNTYTIEKRKLRIDTQGPGTNSNVMNELKYGASQHYTVYLAPLSSSGISVRRT
jgi:hypothetical protein